MDNGMRKRASSDRTRRVSAEDQIRALEAKMEARRAAELAEIAELRKLAAASSNELQDADIVIGQRYVILTGPNKRDRTVVTCNDRGRMDAGHWIYELYKEKKSTGQATFWKRAGELFRLEASDSENEEGN